MQSKSIVGDLPEEVSELVESGVLVEIAVLVVVLVPLSTIIHITLNKQLKTTQKSQHADRAYLVRDGQQA